MDVRNQKEDIDVLLSVLIFSFILSIGKNNVFTIMLKKFNFSFLYNVFLQRRRKIFLNVLYLYKLQYFATLEYKKNTIFFLIKKMLRQRLLIFFYFFFKLLIM